jgi:uncharacterized protein YifN (PemK superfamily)
VITDEQLQSRARKRLRKLQCNPKFQQITSCAYKTAPLTDSDRQQLTHFVEANQAVMKNTVFWGNSTIHPVTTQRHTIHLKKTDK